MTKPNYWNLKDYLLEKIKNNGGWINCHAHIDRAYTANQENFYLTNSQRHEKWLLNKDLRINSSVEEIYDRMAYATETLLSQNVAALATFIDVDCDVKDKAIKASQKLRETFKNDMVFKFMNQSSYGLFNPDTEGRKWFDYAMDYVDIIGGLLKADSGREKEHLDILLSEAKKRNKMVYVHVDELNIPEEIETEILAQKTIEHQMEGKVVAIHGLSINAHPKDYRENIYNLCKKAQLMFISCPITWLNSRRSEVLTPTHNPLTPVDELLEHDITVGIGTDNIADIFMPFNNADMWLDMRILLEAARIHDLDALIKIATTNGRKILGL